MINLENILIEKNIYEPTEIDSEDAAFLIKLLTKKNSLSFTLEMHCVDCNKARVFRYIDGSPFRTGGNPTPGVRQSSNDSLMRNLIRNLRPKRK